MINMIFLIYMNRSGSTLLSRLLDNYKEIGVTPEANLPDGINHGTGKLESLKDIDRFLDEIFTDDRFCSWQLNKKILRDKLIGSLKRLDRTLNFKDFFPVLISEYFKNSRIEKYVYKSPYLFQISKVKDLFPDSKFVLIYRDLRAIYSSQTKTVSTDTNKIMTVSPIKTAIHFNIVCRIIQKYAKNEWFYSVKYENLVMNTELEIHKVLDFLNVGSLTKTENQNYFNKLSEKQKQIHKNLNKTPQADRIDGWRNELDNVSISIIQQLSGKSLRSLGYNIVEISLSFGENLRRLLIWLKFIFTIKGKYTIIKNYIDN